jgi:hypothetical protein
MYANKRRVYVQVRASTVQIVYSCLLLSHVVRSHTNWDAEAQDVFPTFPNGGFWISGRDRSTGQILDSATLKGVQWTESSGFMCYGNCPLRFKVRVPVGFIYLYTLLNFIRLAIDVPIIDTYLPNIATYRPITDIPVFVGYVSVRSYTHTHMSSTALHHIYLFYSVPFYTSLILLYLFYVFYLFYLFWPFYLFYLIYLFCLMYLISLIYLVSNVPNTSNIN